MTITHPDTSHTHQQIPKYIQQISIIYAHGPIPLTYLCYTEENCFLHTTLFLWYPLPEGSAFMTKTVRYAWVSHTGHIRAYNEDNLWCDGIFLPENHKNTPVIEGSLKLSAHPVFAVFDGMGGLTGGGRASFLAASSLRKDSVISSSGEQVFRLLDQKISDSSSGTDSGTTGAFLYLENTAAHACSLGDSSVFLIRQESARLMTMSHIIRNPFTGTRELTRYLGCGQSELVPYEQEERILPGDIFLLCTDGLTDMVSKEDIVSTISGIEVPSEAVTALLTEALARGGYDNITIIMCYINDMP